MATLSQPLPVDSSASGVELAALQLRRRCDPDRFQFATTTDLRPPTDLVGQPRAAQALAFGLATCGKGYNVFVSGPPGAGETPAVRGFLQAAAKSQSTPYDFCYVYNFREPARPRALHLPAGRGRQLREDMRKLVLAVRREIPRVFESEEYIAQREAIVNELNRKREQNLSELAGHAQNVGFRLVQPNPMTLALVPMMGNQPMSDEDLAGLKPDMRAIIERHREELEGKLRVFLKDMRAAERLTRDRLDQQDRDVALQAVGGVVEDLIELYEDLPEVGVYLEQVREGILSDILVFRAHPLPTDHSLPEPRGVDSPEGALRDRALRKYEINVMIDHGDTNGAPVIFEPNPTLPNLLGAIEREALFGALMTDFTLISPGALHQANGGFLMLRVVDILRAPMAWEALKRALRESEVVIEDASEAMGLVGARGLRPDPIPLDVKVFLLGEPIHYHILHAADPDFAELFKIRADFDVIMDWTPENEVALATIVAQSAQACGRPVDRGGVALIVETASRLVADQRKLSTRFELIDDLVRESIQWADAADASVAGAEHVRQAIEQRRYRSSQIQERLREAVARGVLLVGVEGEKVGQINGLAVIDAGDAPFGRPSRITATVGVGREGVLDIERQAELGGRIHSKGVLILGGYLTDLYARDKPLALAARLVFEQSYEEVEGDSASLAELLSLLSRLAEAPIRQGIAVTGSVNQRGEVQAIGGVNEKIEGFFDTCQARGLTGDQGVMIPVSNVEHLMLREDVVAAVEAGRFHVYAVRTVDEALERITGQMAGPRDAAGAFTPNGLHARVDQSLRRLAEALRDFSSPVDTTPNGRRPKR